MQIRLAVEEDTLEIAKIHKSEIGKGFLAYLGEKFLIEFYKAIIKSNFSFCLVAEEGAGIIGFIAGATDIGKFYKYFFKKYFWQTFFIILPKIFDIASVKKIFENILYPQKEKKLPSAELLTIAVRNSFQGRGAGSQLLARLILEMKNRGVAVFKVLVGKELEKSVNFYRKNNFQFLKETILHNGKPSLIFIYKIE